MTVGGLDGTDPVKCSRDVVISPDVALSSIDKDSFDVIVRKKNPEYKQKLETFKFRFYLEA